MEGNGYIDQNENLNFYKIIQNKKGIHDTNEELKDFILSERSRFLRTKLKVDRRFPGLSQIWCAKVGKRHSNLVVYGDELGYIYIGDTHRKVISKYRSLDLIQRGDLLAASGNILARMGLSFNSRIAASGDISLLKITWPKLYFKGHHKSIFNVEWVSNEERILSSSGDTISSLWDVESHKIIYVFSGHFASIKTAKEDPQNPNIFCSGGRDGRILIYDIRANSGSGAIENMDFAIKMMRPVPHAQMIFPEGALVSGTEGEGVRTLKQGSPASLFQSITGLEFFMENCLLSTQDSCPFISIWDLRKFSSAVSPYYYDVDKGVYKQKRYLKQPLSALRTQKDNNWLSVGGTQFNVEIARFHQSLAPWLLFHSQVHRIPSGPPPPSKYEEEGYYMGEESYFSMEYSNSMECSDTHTQNINCEYKEVHKRKEYIEKSNIGYASIFLSEDQRVLAGNAMNSVIYIYNMSRFDIQPPRRLRGHTTSFYNKCSLSPCSQFLATGSKGTGDIYYWDLHGGGDMGGDMGGDRGGDSGGHGYVPTPAKPRGEENKGNGPWGEAPAFVQQDVHMKDVNEVSWGLGDAILSSGDDNSVILHSI